MKNLEDEYKKSQQEPVPQLWDRIEQNLPEKKKKKNVTYISRILGICAAAVVVILLLPNIFNFRMDRSESAAPSAPKTYDYIAQDSCQENEELTIQGETTENLVTGDEQQESDSTAEKEVAAQESSGIGEGTDTTKNDIYEKMKVMDFDQSDSIKTYTLERTDGSTIRASLSDEITVEPEVGKSYLFTITKESANSSDYIVNKIEEIKN